MHIAVFKMDKQQDLLNSTGSSAQCRVAAWLGQESEEEWTRVYVHVWLSPFSVHLRLSQHLKSATLKYKVWVCFFFLNEQ